MCGIVGYIGNRQAAPILIDGLARLEYRGYDSAGIAVFDDGRQDLEIVKAKGRLSELSERLNGRRLSSVVGLGHTRWATHGRPSDANAHPHCDCSGAVVVVHNGIIENYLELKEDLIARGHSFRSETDTEVIAHLIEEFLKESYDMETAFRRAVRRLQGSFAIGAICKSEPEKLFAVRNESPLIIGIGSGENFIASDIPAVLSYTRDVQILNDGEFCVVTKSGVIISDIDGALVNKDVMKIQWDAKGAEKAGYPHFMLKEIHEQPRAVKDTLSGRIDRKTGDVVLNEISLTDQQIKAISKINIVACGTAYHAGLVGRHLIENLARIPVEVSLASEFRYADPMIDESMLTIVISQSGETADTLAAIREAKAKACRVLAITNVVGSSVARESDDVIYTWAGPEIAVASTKAYTTQLVTLVLLAIYLGRRRGLVSLEEAKRLTDELQRLPGNLQKVIADNEENIRRYAKLLRDCESVFYIGRGLDYAVSQEGQLKLKEISYIHAEALAAGELKHGTLALCVEGVPVIALVTQKKTREKTRSNIKEVKARDATVIALARESDHEIAGEVDYVLWLPDMDDMLMPTMLVVPTQLLAYYTAVERGCDVDKPRNLAKSVTVE
ncbi:MAG: glutamine--fructose-6-phosphate transaminase (isomerizing) [Firmicutes bacterium]|nr:glutamine--fructose-6-phosphate transaminase (isomerizing) [Bacillota bacterium]